MRRDLGTVRRVGAAVITAALLLAVLPCPDEAAAAGLGWRPPAADAGDAHCELDCVCSCHVSWDLAAAGTPLSLALAHVAPRHPAAPPASFAAAPSRHPPRTT